jgi:hypothetical protein
VDDGDAVGALQVPERRLDRGLEVALVVLRDQVRDNLGIGLAVKATPSLESISRSRLR